jgi:hypothetical protein
MLFSLMVVSDLNLEGIASLPYKANAPLVVDADAVLTLAVFRESFRPITRRDAHIVESPGVMQLKQLAIGDPNDIVRNTFDEPAFPSGSRSGIPKRLDHEKYYRFTEASARH